MTIAIMEIGMTRTVVVKSPSSSARFFFLCLVGGVGESAVFMRVVSDPLVRDVRSREERLKALDLTFATPANATQKVFVRAVRHVASIRPEPHGDPDRYGGELRHR